MSVGPLGNTTALSGAGQDAANQVRRAQSNEKAQQAAGLNRAEADEGTTDRDADGRRLWEFKQGEQANEEDEHPEANDQTEQQGETPQSKDPTGTLGSVLDLSG